MYFSLRSFSWKKLKICGILSFVSSLTLNICITVHNKKTLSSNEVDWASETKQQTQMKISFPIENRRSKREEKCSSKKLF